MSETRSISKEYRLSYWANVMKERSNSGQSIRAYCEKAGIHENTYFYWQRRLREAAIMELRDDKPNITVSEPKGWAMLCVGGGSGQPQGLTVEVNGCRITVSDNTDTGLLAKVCRALQEGTC
jgi:putative transposase